jgi:DNA-nicking Smr family endonuclease
VDPPFPDPIPQPVAGELDLHTFRQQDLGELIPEYLAACREQGIFTVRIVHGKGTGTLRETVHALLRRIPEVSKFHLAPETAGGWGATVAHLQKTEAQ